jgi:hypothetical protein
MKNILFLSLFATKICAQVEVDSVITVDGVTAPELYQKLDSWISTVFVDSRSAIEYRSSDSKQISGSGYFTVPVKVMITYHAIVPFDFDIKTKDGKYKIHLKADRMEGFKGTTDTKERSLHDKSNYVFYSQKKWEAFKLDIMKKFYEMIDESKIAAEKKASDW